MCSFLLWCAPITLRYFLGQSCFNPKNPLEPAAILFDVLDSRDDDDDDQDIYARLQYNNNNNNAKKGEIAREKNLV